jgi:hypothetical protein
MEYEEWKGKGGIGYKRPKGELSWFSRVLLQSQKKRKNCRREREGRGKGQRVLRVSFKPKR